MFVSFVLAHANDHYIWIYLKAITETSLNTTSFITELEKIISMVTEWERKWNEQAVTPSN
jgi:hypothetical protein